MFDFRWETSDLLYWREREAYSFPMYIMYIIRKAAGSPLTRSQNLLFSLFFGGLGQLLLHNCYAEAADSTPLLKSVGTVAAR